MKIKHWQGYGCVSARKLSEKKLSETTAILKIEVKGNHECGIERNDTYDVFRWLLNDGKRFTKDCKTYRDIYKLNITTDIVMENGQSVDIAYYEIYYRL
ncbi:hypothetical protein J6A31_05825 [bacterium]|nr:hypothetical protein [bacterium]